MRKFLLAVTVFVISAGIGIGLLAIGVMVQMAWHLLRHSHSGMGGFAGGLSRADVLVVPVLCGLAGAAYVLYRWRGQH